MFGNASKYALVDGKEVVLLEAIRHASSDKEACI